MFDLTGRTALVTGATGGIGGAIARALHQQGAAVALSGTRREVLDQIAGELQSRVHVLPCNLADKEEVEALVPKCEEVMGQLDIAGAQRLLGLGDLGARQLPHPLDSVEQVREPPRRLRCGHRSHTARVSDNQIPVYPGFARCVDLARGWMSCSNTDV